MTKWIVRIVVLLLFCAIVIFVYQGIKYNLLEKKLREKDAEISELAEKNEELQKEKDEAIAAKLEEIAELTEERNVALERVAELEPAVQEADLRIERLEQEYEELVASGAPVLDLLKNALAQVDTLKLEVIQVKEQRDKALNAFNLEAASKAAALQLADQWRQKFESEHSLRLAEHDAYEICKDQNRGLRLKGKLGTAGGFVLGLIGGLLLGK